MKSWEDFGNNLLDLQASVCQNGFSAGSLVPLLVTGSL